MRKSWAREHLVFGGWRIPESLLREVLSTSEEGDGQFTRLELRAAADRGGQLDDWHDVRVLYWSALKNLQHLKIYYGPAAGRDPTLSTYACISFQLTTLTICLVGPPVDVSFLRKVLIASKDTLRTLDLDTSLMMDWRKVPLADLIPTLSIVAPTFLHLNMATVLSMNQIAGLLPTFTSLETLTLTAPVLCTRKSSCPASKPSRSTPRRTSPVFASSTSDAIVAKVAPDEFMDVLVSLIGLGHLHQLEIHRPTIENFDGHGGAYVARDS